MRELSLFSGAGGGLLGSLLLGWTPVGYVEYNDYCQRVIAQRIKDGILPNAPIYGDVRTFISEGYAASYTGLVDVISGGFPCQPFSVAGKRAGADDPRNMWPATIATIRAVRPRFAFLENVAGLLTSGYFGTIVGDLAESGYDCRWRILSAAEVGAPHKRDRLWIVADSDSFRRDASKKIGRGNGDLYRRNRQTTKTNNKWISDNELGKNGSNRHVADADNTGLAQWDRRTAERGTRTTIDGCSWWATEPNVGRVANELSDWLDFAGTDTKGLLR